MEAKQGITGRGAAWEWKRSWFVLFSFIGCAWIGFLAIWLKARRKRWLVLMLIYLALQLGGFIAVDLLSEDDPALTYVSFMWLGSYPAGIIASFRERPKYLLCLDLLVITGADEASRRAFQAAVAMDYAQKGVLHPLAPESVEKERDILDINRCSAPDLAALPGVSVAMAKKAWDWREAHGGFSSVDEFYSLLELKPHFVAQLEGVIQCGPYESRELPAAAVTEAAPEEAGTPAVTGALPERRGRRLDF